MAGPGPAIPEDERVDARRKAGHDGFGGRANLTLPQVSSLRSSPQFAAPALPKVIGHRGAAGRAPENTLAGLRKAKEIGCAWVEFDARLTADGVPVLCHDPRLERTTDRSGVIATLPLAAVREADAGCRFGAEFAGERVPMLEEALLLCAELDLGANIEIKADHGRHYAAAAAVRETLQKLGGRLPALLVSSFQPWTLVAFGTRPQVPLGSLWRVVPRNWAKFVPSNCRVIGADHRRLRRRQVAVIRDTGCQLAAYTVNDPARASVLFDWGVTSVFTDVPDILLEGGAGRRPARADVAAPSRAAGARQGAIR